MAVINLTNDTQKEHLWDHRERILKLNNLEAEIARLTQLLSNKSNKLSAVGAEVREGLVAIYGALDGLLETPLTRIDMKDVNGDEVTTSDKATFMATVTQVISA